MKLPFISHKELKRIIKRIAVKGDNPKVKFVEVKQLKKEIGL